MKRLAQLTLRVYQRMISPSLAPACRYLPTCSQYAAEAVERYGVLGGGARALWRVLRCHPLARGGYDPVWDLKRKPSWLTSRGMRDE